MADLARRLEQLSTVVIAETEHLLEGRAEPVEGRLAIILNAAKRAAELARELAKLPRKDTSAAAIDASETSARLAVPSLSDPSRENVLVHSQKRLRAGADGTPSLVLLVEDEALLLRTVRRMLEKLGCRVLAATCGKEAIELAAAQGAIEVVVTDLALPGIGGVEVVRALRRTRPGLRVLYTSGWDLASSGVKLAVDGSEAFLPKPFTSGELKQCLRALLEPETLKARGVQG